MSQTLHNPRTARLSALIAALALACLTVLGTASPAAAHDALVGTDPAVDSTVAQLPQQVTLTFSEEVADDEGATVIEVKDAAGTSLVDGSPVVQDNTVTQSLKGQATGVVTVTWKIVSSDGHPTSNAFSFTVEGAPAPTPTASAVAPTPTATTPTPDASQTFTPGPPMETPDDDAAAWPWIVAGIIVAAALAGIAYLLVSRSRRQKDLAQLSGGGSPDAAGPGAEPGSEPGSTSGSDH